MMTLYEFLRLHEGGVACVSIAENETSIKKQKIQYCEEENQEDILESEWFEKIANRRVKRFCVIGGGMYKVELCIEVASEDE